VTRRLLLFAEDPGGALFMQHLPAAWEAWGGTACVLALPHAAPYFAGRPLVAMPAGSGPSDASALLTTVNADVLVTGTSENPDTFGFRLIAAAREMDIPSFGAVDSSPNAPYRFRGRSDSPMTHTPDFLLVPDLTTEQEYIKLGLAPDRVLRVGHPRLSEIARLRHVHDRATVARARQKLFPEAGDRPIILFVSELSVGLGDDPFRRTARYTLAGTGMSERRSEIVAQELLRAARLLPSNPWLVLRLHPKQGLDDVAGIADQFDQVSCTEPGLDVVGSVDLVTGMTSVLLAEAAVLGRPVLSIVPDPSESAWLGDFAERIVSVSTRVALEAALANWPAVLPPCGEEGVDPAALMAEVITRCIAL
jgi:hypothetical protein